MNGIVKGSIIHIHRARTIIVDTDGLITASELGRRRVFPAFFFSFCHVLLLVFLMLVARLFC